MIIAHNRAEIHLFNMNTHKLLLGIGLVLTGCSEGRQFHSIDGHSVKIDADVLMKKFRPNSNEWRRENMGGAVSFSGKDSNGYNVKITQVDKPESLSFTVYDEASKCSVKILSSPSNDTLMYCGLVSNPVVMTWAGQISLDDLNELEINGKSIFKDQKEQPSLIAPGYQGTHHLDSALPNQGGVSEPTKQSDK